MDIRMVKILFAQSGYQFEDVNYDDVIVALGEKFEISCAPDLTGDKEVLIIVVNGKKK